MTLQDMRRTDHVTLNFNNNMSTAAVFLDIEKTFDITWNPCLLYKLRDLQFSASIIRLTSSFPSNMKLRVSAEGEMSSSWEIETRVPQGPVLSPYCVQFVYK